MQVGSTVRKSRRRAAMSQRQLAIATGVAQPTIARIERGIDNPRVGTVQTLLSACGETLIAIPRADAGIDRSEIRELLKLTPAERLAAVAQESELLDRLDHARKVTAKRSRRTGKRSV